MSQSHQSVPTANAEQSHRSESCLKDASHRELSVAALGIRLSPSVSPCSEEENQNRARPVISTLRASRVPESKRVTVMTLFRLPLNVFVLGGLGKVRPCV